MKNIIVFVIALLININNVYACSAVVLKNENDVFLAKNFDWTFGNGYLIKNLRGVNKKAFYSQAGEPVSWKSNYGSITFNQNGKEMPYGGMNEKGLTVEMLWLDNANYGNPENTYLNELEWIQYQLDNFATTEEVIINLNKLSINPIKGKIHYIVADTGGNSVVIDFINDTIVCTQKEISQCQAITNNSAIESQTDYEKQKSNLKGSNKNAFHRYNILQRKIDNNQFNKKSLSSEDGFNALDDVNISEGKFRTFWSVVYDLKNRSVYFKTERAKEIKQLDLYLMDFENELLGVDLNSNITGNISKALTAYTQEINKMVIKKSFTGLGLEKVNADELTKHQFNFDSGINNSYTQNYSALEIIFKTKEDKLGFFIFAIMSGEENFKNQKSIEGGANGFNIDAPVYQWNYYGLPKGRYAVAVLKDLNKNKQLDFDDQNNPMEKYAFSNGMRVTNGEFPRFEKCAVNCMEGNHLITLNIE